ncbi:MAG: PQQ-like beta-propeller repeat protein [Myxococcales bacterium]|nr:PQQ-like beta-propeller repeat protein [Myxococcales bacterium]
MTAILLLTSALSSAALPFVPAPTGCAQAHCDAQLSDQAGLPPPPAGSIVKWHDDQAAGSNYALGCSSNGRRAACSFGLVPARGPYLVVYDADGQRLWDAPDVGPGAASSAPVIDAQGQVIAADGDFVYRFGVTGREIWRHALPPQAGLPVSPVVTSGGFVVYATTGGLVGAVDSTDGTGITRALEATIDGYSGVFVTRNTPASRGDRVYVVAEFQPDDNDASDVIGEPARLYALDVSDGAIDVAWFYDVGGRSGASPTVVGDVVYFDADQLTASGPTAPHFFAVRDTGPAGALVYAHPLTDPVIAPSGTGGALASAAHDPRGGLWLFTAGSARLVRLSETAARATGSPPRARVLDDLDLSALLGADAQPSSAVTLADGASGPVGMMTALVDGDTRWLALDLVQGSLQNDVSLGSGLATWSAAQSPIITHPQTGASVVVLSTFSDGVLGITVP